MCLLHFVFLLERFVCIFISLKYDTFCRKTFNIALFSIMPLKHTGLPMEHIYILCSFESVSYLILTGEGSVSV